MKSNMIMVIAAIVALFTLAVGLYGVSAVLLPAHSQSANDHAGNETGSLNPAENETVAGTVGPRTAFEALTITSADPAIKSWIADKKIVYVASISSDFSSEGLSDTWTITYASDDGQIMACVVQGTVVDARTSRSSPQQGIDPGKAIDSVKAWESVADYLAASGSEAPQVESMTLKVAGGKPRWDVSYQSPGGFHIVRVDAGNGSITDSAIIGQG